MRYRVFKNDRGDWVVESIGGTYISPAMSGWRAAADLAFRKAARRVGFQLAV